MSAVLRNKNTRYLIKELRNRSSLKFIGDIPNYQLETRIVVPVAIARWIEIFRAQLKNKKVLNIIVAGSELGPDSVENGIWYQLIPELLDSPELEVNISMVGPNVFTSTRTGFDPSIHGLPNKSLVNNYGGWNEASFHNQTIGDYLRANEGKEIDLVFLSHPGFENHIASWFDPDELGAVIKRGIPIASSSYDIREYQQEQWLARVFGYEATGRIDINPFSLEEEEAMITTFFCHTLWEFSNKSPSVDFEPDLDDIIKLNDHAEFAHALLGSGDFHYIKNVLGKPPIERNGCKYIGLPNNVMVEIPSGKVYINLGNSYKDTEIVIPKEHIDSYPADVEYAFEKEIWIAQSFLILTEIIEYALSGELQ
jgi:hypothetical protein